MTEAHKNYMELIMENEKDKTTNKTEKATANIGDKPLENVKWELFAQLISTGKTGEEAYAEAGFKSKYPRKNAPHLLKKPQIQARIRHFTAEAAIKAGITRETQAQKLEDVILRARAAGDRTNEVAAIREQNKLYGLSADKIIHGDEPDELSQERLEIGRQLAKEAVERERLRLIKMSQGGD